MRHFQAATAITLAAIAIALLGVTVINAKTTTPAATVPASNAINTMQLMIDAKDLPIEQFDAY